MSVVNCRRLIKLILFIITQSITIIHLHRNVYSSQTGKLKRSFHFHAEVITLITEQGLNCKLFWFANKDLHPGNVFDLINKFYTVIIWMAPCLQIESSSKCIRYTYNYKIITIINHKVFYVTCVGTKKVYGKKYIEIYFLYLCESFNQRSWNKDKSLIDK